MGGSAHLDFRPDSVQHPALVAVKVAQHFQLLQMLCI